MREVIVERVGGVEIVFRKREGAGGGGGPGVHQSGLHHLILFDAAAHEGAAVFDWTPNSGPRIEPWLSRHEFVAHDVVGDDGIDLDGGDIVAAGGQRARDVLPAARADDQGFGAGTDQRRADPGPLWVSW